MPEERSLIRPSDIDGYDREVEPLDSQPTVAGSPAGKWDWEKALLARSRKEGMKPGHQHVALLLATYADGDGTSIRPTIATLTQVSGRSKATIQEALAYLRRSGWVQQLARGSGASGQASEYRLTVPPRVQ